MYLFTVTVHQGHHTWIKLCVLSAQILILKSHASIVPSSNLKDSLCNMQPINVLFTVDVTKAGNDCFKLLLKTAEDQEEEEATVHLVNNGCC